ncbi:hypothetical protein XA68_16671 [Ophiocordyceps unilateralis]|uniref:Glutaredoxin domain-containing protein n=1 Tax=Ophiocordyceps unilateralis TaxID=268505 RepID=A0A2A9PKV0_OPHUN|nr:hypothetical protein XA68_16671 [Ophiocordyceps unilateralis]
MPSPRRLRLLMLATVVGVVFILFYASSFDDSASRDSRTIKDFYRKTMDGMKKGAPPGQAVLDRNRAANDYGDEQRLASSTKERLRAAEEKAKAKANTKALRPDPPSQVVGVGNSADGQAKKPRPADVEPKKEFDAKQELDDMVKDRPVVIFSKTTCPFSKHAKGILLEKYHINPPPFVVELDVHEYGKALQDELYRRTQQRTVPNIIINDGSGDIVSLGGSDDIVELDNAGSLARKIGDVSKGLSHVKLRRLAVNPRGL